MNYNHILSAFWEGIRPAPNFSVAEWADNYRMLSSEASAYPGRWRTERTPYLKEIMYNLSPNSPVIEVVVMKSVQLGYTEVGLNLVGCFIDIDPCPIMYVLPTIDMAKGISTSRIDTMIEASPSLSAKIPSKQKRDSGNTVLVKKFPGGLLVLVGANSASALRSRPIRVLILDEVDGYPLSVDEEGSPSSLAQKRTVTYANKKIYKLSTPTVEGLSVIAKEFETTDKRKFYVPLPCCGSFQTLEFENLVWEKGIYENVKYKCKHCDSLVEERFKGAFLAGGEWKATDPEKASQTRIGYHMNALYSPPGWLSWSDIAKEWDEIESTNDQMKLRTFVNTILAETYKQTGEAPEWQNIYNKRERYKKNSPKTDVAFLTMGVDIQKDRIELEIVGWMAGKISQSIDYRVLEGDTEKTEVWEKLAEVISETFIREDGAEMNIKMAAIDTGYNTSKVYDFCKKYQTSQVIPVKGSDKTQFIIGSPKLVDYTSKGKKIGNLRVWMVGVDIIKTELYGWLRLQKEENKSVPPGYCYFPEYSEEYFRGLTAEHQVFKEVNGFKKYAWVKKYARNEPLDCRVYARAAAAVVGMDRFTEAHWLDYQKKYPKAEKKQVTEQTKQQTTKKRNSSYWD